MLAPARISRSDQHAQRACRARDLSIRLLSFRTPCSPAARREMEAQMAAGELGQGDADASCWVFALSAFSRGAPLSAPALRVSLPAVQLLLLHRASDCRGDRSDPG